MAYTTQTQRWQAYLSALKTDFTKICKLEFLQPDGSVAYVLDNNPRNPRSSAFIQNGTIRVNLQNGQRRQATVNIVNLDGAYDYAVNKVWFGQEIRLSEGLILPDGSEFYLPQGVFLVKDAQEIFKPGQREVSYPLVDKWANLDGTLYGNLEGTYEVPVDVNIFDAIAELLREDRGNGRPVDGMTPIFTSYYNGMTTEDRGVIYDNIMTASENTHEAHEELMKAEKTNKKSRSKICFQLLVVLGILAAVIVIIVVPVVLSKK